MSAASPIVYAALVLTGYYVWRRTKIPTAAPGLEQLAQKYNLHVTAGPVLIGSNLYNLDKTIDSTAYLTGEIAGATFRLFQYYPSLPAHTVDSNTNAAIAVMQFDVPNSFFEFYMVSAGNDEIASRFRRLANFRALKLEGNFNEHFALTVKKGMEIDALQLFDPDTMVDVMQHFWMYNFELANNQLTIYREGIDINAIAARPDLLSSLDVFCEDAAQIGELLLQPLLKMKGARVS